MMCRQRWKGTTKVSNNQVTRSRSPGPKPHALVQQRNWNLIPYLITCASNTQVNLHHFIVRVTIIDSLGAHVLLFLWRLHLHGHRLAEAFSGVSGKLLGSRQAGFREASGKPPGSFREASGQHPGTLPGSSWEASGKLPGTLPGSFREASGKLPGNLPGSFREASGKLPGNLPGSIREASRNASGKLPLPGTLPGRLRGASGDACGKLAGRFWEASLEAARQLPESFWEVFRKLPRSFRQRSGHVLGNLPLWCEPHGEWLGVYGRHYWLRIGCCIFRFFHLFLVSHWHHWFSQ